MKCDTCETCLWWIDVETITIELQEPVSSRILWRKDVFQTVRQYIQKPSRCKRFPADVVKSAWDWCGEHERKGRDDEQAV